METFEAVRTVLAVRSYTDQPVPPEIVQRIVESAHLTASSSNSQPWHFIAVRDRDTLQRLGEALSHGPYIAEAPLAIAVVIDRTPPAVSDGSRAIQSMLLTAWSEGLGGNWVGFVGQAEEARPILAIPDDHDILAIVPIGYPTSPGGMGRKNRKPFDEVVYAERWEQPFTRG
jgi:nitroreductase